MSYELNIRCSKCSKFILMKATNSSAVEVRCTDRQCKAWNTIKVVMLSDYYKQPHSHAPEPPANEADSYRQSIADLQAKVAELDGRTKEAKKLKAELQEANDYIEKLEAL